MQSTRTLEIKHGLDLNINILQEKRSFVYGYDIRIHADMLGNLQLLTAMFNTLFRTFVIFISKPIAE